VALFSPDGAIGFEVVGSAGRLTIFGDAAKATLWRNEAATLEDVALPPPTNDDWLAGQVGLKWPPCRFRNISAELLCVDAR
jgi:hypothetical protein